MGCVSSTLLTHDADDFTQIGASSAFAHHIVSLTSTTYGLLTLDPPSADHDHSSSSSSSSPPPPPITNTTITATTNPRFTLGELFPTPLVPSDPTPFKPEVINSWELMAGLDSTPLAANHSFRFSPFPPPKPRKENSNPNLPSQYYFHPPDKPSSDDVVLAPKNSSLSSFLERFDMLCPPNGQDRVVLYTTTLRGIRKTFEACNAVRSAIEALGILFCERDISMDSGFREELRELMKGRDNKLVPPRLFVKGRYIGGVEEILRVVEGGCLPDLVQGLPKVRTGYVCEGCGGARFLPCFRCNGSCKMVMDVGEGEVQKIGQKQARTVVVRCSDCNENGLTLCPICS